MVYFIKIFPDICFEHIPLFAIPGNLSFECLKALQRRERSLPFAVRIAIVDEVLLEDRLEDIHDGVMHYPITEIAHADPPGLRITENECPQRPWPICTEEEFKAKLFEIYCEIALEILDIRLGSFSLPRFPEGEFEVFWSTELAEEIPVGLHANRMSGLRYSGNTAIVVVQVLVVAIEVRPVLEAIDRQGPCSLPTEKSPPLHDFLSYSVSRLYSTQARNNECAQIGGRVAQRSSALRLY